VRRIFSPERAKGEIIGDGVNKPAETANLLVDKLVGKDIVSL
jgi:electron transfer flavoprotein beta subunit